MSDSFQIDAYLAAQPVPVQPDGYGIFDTEFQNMRWVTPVGRFLNCNVAQPRAVMGAKPEPGEEPALPRYNITLAFAPNVIEELWGAICSVADQAFPQVQYRDPANPTQVLVKTGGDMLLIPEAEGGYHCPLYAGNKKYAQDPKRFDAYRGLSYFNAAMYPKTKGGVDQRPITKDVRGHDCDPSVFYPGCYGRAIITIASYTYEKMKKRGVSTRLQGVQFAKAGARLGGFDASTAVGNAFVAAGALPIEQMEVPGDGTHPLTGRRPAPIGGMVPPNPNPAAFAGPAGATRTRPPGV